MPDEPPSELDERGQVACDVACLQCGYDLRMQHVDGACPECGTPVRVSLRRDRLDDSDPDYLKRLSRGAGWFRVGVAATVVLLYFGLLIAAAGVWRLTRAEPGRVEPEYDRRLRLMARWFLVIGLFGSLPGFAVGLVLMVREAHWLMQVRNWQPVDVVLVSLHGMMFLGFLATWEYLGVLGRRMEDAQLIRRCVRMRWVWVIGLTLVCSLALGTSTANWLHAANWGRLSLRWQAAGALVPLGLTAAILLWMWVETLRLAGVLKRKLAGLTRG